MARYKELYSEGLSLEEGLKRNLMTYFDGTFELEDVKNLFANHSDRGVSIVSVRSKTRDQIRGSVVDDLYEQIADVLEDGRYIVCVTLQAYETFRDHYFCIKQGLPIEGGANKDEE